MKTGLFIAGSPRSGTTILYRHMQCIERCVALPSHAQQAPFSFQDKLFAVIEKYSGFALPKNIKTRKSPFWDRVRMDMTIAEFHTLLKEFLGSFYSDEKIFVNKRIDNMNILPFLSHQFENTILIHMIRKPEDVVLSIVKKRENKNAHRDIWWGVVPQGLPAITHDYLLDCINQYRYSNILIEKYQNLFSKYIVVHYEEYCSNPEKAIKNIMSQAGLNENNIPPPPEPINFKTYKALENIRARIKESMR